MVLGEPLDLLVDQGPKLGPFRRELRSFLASLWKRPRLALERLDEPIRPETGGRFSSPRHAARGRRGRDCGSTWPCGPAPETSPGRRRQRREGRSTFAGKRPGPSARAGSQAPRTPPRRDGWRTARADRRPRVRRPNPLRTDGGHPPDSPRNDRSTWPVPSTPDVRSTPITARQEADDMTNLGITQKRRNRAILGSFEFV